MKLTLTSKHELLGSGYFIGVDDENRSDQLIVNIQYEALLDKWAYIEFQVNDDQKYMTQKLDIVDEKIVYDIPNGLLKEGHVKVQVVFRDADGYVWKSFTRRFIVSDSIRACDNLPDEYPDFIGEAQKLLDEIEIQADKVDEVLITEEERKAAEIARQTAETTRINNENTRVSSETTRKTAETERIANENTRIANEAGRVSAEQTRQTTFNGWKDNLGNLNTYDKRLINLEEAGVGTIFDYQTDSTTAYSKNVPSKACSYALLNKVGGMTYKQDETLVDAGVTEIKVFGKNLFDISQDKHSGSSVIVAKTENELTLKQTVPTAWIMCSFVLPFSNDFVGKKITISGNYKIEGEARGGLRLQWLKDGVAIGSGIAASYTPAGSTEGRIAITGSMTEKLADADVLALLVYSNTEGTYVEGSTITYSNIQVEIGETATAYESYRENNISIPSGIQVLDGYGLGINDTCYNYIDFDRKKYVQKLSSITYTKDDVTLAREYDNVIYYEVPKPTNFSGYGAYDREALFLSSMFDKKSSKNWDDSLNINTIAKTADEYSFWIGFAKGTTLEEAQATINSLEIIYELATPIETDISAYIEDNYIRVYPNGSIVFENEHSLAAPSEITYVVKK